ncbi:MAG: Fur family transcriptional regulator [Nocardioidaceae bacterium]
MPQADTPARRQLREAGLRVTGPRQARYERRTGDNHHHMVCRARGRVEDVDCAVGAQPCLTPTDARGFELDEAEVVFWGVCLDCWASKTSATNRSSHHKEAQQ